ncbi:hypothetical protein [Caldanaerobacter sp.]|uniref:hypothetical protein n=1 Tax=Caldanaerobacter sp. TaxID=2930036 RepID=UPI003C716496
MKVSKRALIAVLLLLLSLQIFLPKPAYGENHKKAIIFIVDRVNLKDYLSNDLPAIKFLIEKGTYSLMTVNSDGAKTPENVYVTLGSGTRAVGSEKAFLNFNTLELVYGGETAGTIFERNTGLKPSPHNIVNLDIAQIQRNNLTRNHIIVPGAMGSLLKEKGKKIAVLGNEGNTLEAKRYAPLIFMDKRGIVEFGDVSDSSLKRDIKRPFGISTDYEYLYKKYLEVKDKADLIVFQLGDTFRANEYQRFALDRVNDRYREKALKEVDNFIGKILKDGQPNTLYILLTPLPPSKDLSLKSYIVPFVIFGPGFTEGYAVSDTTRRTGIVSNLDFMPTILKYFDIPIPAYVTGHPVYSSGVKGSVQFLLEEGERLVFNYSSRPIFLKAYGYFQIATFIILAIGLFLIKKHFYYEKYLLFFISVVPLSFLLLPLFDYYTFFKSTFFLIGLSIGITALLAGLSRSSYYFYFLISFITITFLVIDLVTGQYLLKNSLLSYDVIAGARFYGIGNEYMGVLIGATLCFAAFLFERFSKRWALFMISALYILVLFLMASPSFGAKVGGAITGFAVFSVSILLFKGIKVDWKRVIAIVLSIVVILLGLFYVDYLKPFSYQTHMGQTFALVKSHGIGALFQIFARKLLMNYKLIKNSIWSRDLAVFFALLGVLAVAKKEVLKEIFKKHPHILKSSISALIGAIVALAFNDAGVIAASTMTVFLGPLLFHLVIDEVGKG